MAQGVLEILAHFVLDLSNSKILFISYVKPFILKLTQNGENEYSLFSEMLTNPEKLHKQIHILKIWKKGSRFK